MLIRADNLRQDLYKIQRPVYLVCGEEPLQHRDAIDIIRKAARYYGFNDRETYTVESGFDWRTLYQAGCELSLFSEKKLIEVHLPKAGPGKDGAEAIKTYLQSPPQDTILLLTLGKLESAWKKSAWFKSIDQAGAIIQVWPVTGMELLNWLDKRGRKAGLILDRESLMYLAENVEGNMLAADQELEKLALTFRKDANGDEPVAVDVQAVKQSIADNSRYNVFELFDTALARNPGRALRMLEGLKQQAQPVVLLHFILTREVRMLATLSGQLRHEPLSKVISHPMIFNNRKKLIGEVLTKSSWAFWVVLLQRLHTLDRMIKGLEVGDPWSEMKQLLAAIAGYDKHGYGTQG